jgi:two-component system sensor histidine kinase UhpB
VDELIAFWTARQPDLKVDLDIPETSFGPRTDAALQAIIGESVSNAMKHARPKTLVITVATAGRYVKLQVSDDGGGFRKIRSIDGGYGILGMKERAQNLGGSLSVAETQGGRGVSVRASLPLATSAVTDVDAAVEALAS